MPHGHVHVPHELTESNDEPEVDPSRPARSERLLEFGTVLLLSLTTPATAWSGYQAALWSGEQSQHYARASDTRIKAQQQETSAGQLRIDDLLYFNEWLNARSAGNHLVESDRAAALDDQADELYLGGTEAKTNDDHYILSTVFFAAVLFLPASRCGWSGGRCACSCSGWLVPCCSQASASFSRSRSPETLRGCRRGPLLRPSDG